jgi:hypothetical protein
MNPKQATIALLVVPPHHVQLVETIHGEPTITHPPVPYHANMISELEKKYIFQEGQAEWAKRELENKLSYAGVVYVRE